MSFAVTAKLISAFAFATRIVQFLSFLSLKFPASSHHLSLYAGLCQTWSETQIVGFLFTSHGIDVHYELNRIPYGTYDATITITCPCNIYPILPHLYLEKKKLGFAGVYLFFLIFAPKHRLWVLVRTASVRRF